MSEKWFRSGEYRGAPTGTVKRETGVIEGISVATMGAAKGHGVFLDSEFLDDVVELGNAKKQGIKMRFGHPNMCSTALGTFLGRAKNFRRVGDVVKADAFLSNTAKETPGGDLYNYVFDIAEKEPDMFGTSIAFTPGDEYKRGKINGEKYKYNFDQNAWIDAEGDELELHDLTVETFIEIVELHADDFVDDPAANDGLFSAETIAGELTHFMNENPDILERLAANPQILKALTDHGDKTGEFIAKYEEYARQTITNKETENVKEEDQNEEVAVEESNVEAIDAETNDAPDAKNAETDGGEQLETNKEEPAEEVAEEIEQVEEPAQVEEQLSADVFEAGELAKAIEEFGAEIAAVAIANGEGYEGAQVAYYADLKKQNEELRSKAKAFSGEQASNFSAEPQKKKSRFNTGK